MAKTSSQQACVEECQLDEVGERLKRRLSGVTVVKCHVSYLRGVLVGYPRAFSDQRCFLPERVTLKR